MKLKFVMLMLILVLCFQLFYLSEDIKSLNNDIQVLDLEIENLNGKIRTLNSKIHKREKIDSDKELLGVFKATAYTDNVASQGKWVGQTATGRKPQVGIIAVDPNVIKLNTKLYIEGYGHCIAGDTGGAIKGNRIDLYFNTKTECDEFGVKNLKVYTIKSVK